MKRLRTLFRLVPVVAAALLATACDDPVGDGLVVGTDYQVLITTPGVAGALVTVDPVGNVTGAVAVDAGGQRAVTIQLRGRDGGAVTTGPGDQLRVVVTNTTVASFQAGAQTGATRAGTFVAVAPSGNTTFRVQYLQAGLIAFESPLIGLNVD